MKTRIIELLKDIKSLINNQKTEDKWLDINGASKYTSLSKATLRRSVKSGDLKASNKVGKTMFKQSAVESWLS